MALLVLLSVVYLTRFAGGAMLSGIDEVDDTVADWEASGEVPEFLGIRRRNERSCFAETSNSKFAVITVQTDLHIVIMNDGI